MFARKSSHALTLLAATFAARFAMAEPTHLARDGSALQTVIVAEDASERIRRTAATLAEYLRRISGAPFQVAVGDGAAGVAVGLPAHFPDLSLTGEWLHPGPLERERYLLRSHTRGVYVVGATELAVEHAVWDLLYRLGHRQFFPGPTWEVIPTVRDLSVDVDADESPDYHNRRIWYGFGAWDYAVQPYQDWCSRNRSVSAFSLNTGHAYGGIIREKRAQFAEHPEYVALVDGRRQTDNPDAKLCLSNPDLRKLVVEYAREFFDRHPEADSMSVDPSDGGGWCQCEACAALGSVSDRAVTLANEVAAAVAARGKWVGMYAYNQHSPPPSIDVQPNVIISVATSFLRGGLTLDEILTGWSARHAPLGIREYYSVNTWDRDLPGRARGGNLAYLARTIPEFHARGARFLSAESSDNWGPNGLGYYVASRILWDVREADRVPQLVDDFLLRAFGPAREPMAEFYRQLDGAEPHLVVDDRLGRMYAALADARRRADRPEIRARLDDLTLYTRYADLYDRYAQAEGPARQAAFEELIRHAYRMRTTMMIHAKALYRDLVTRDKQVSIPEDARWNVPEGRNPWKSSAPFSPAELEQFIAEGIESRPLVHLDFEPVSYSERLVPARSLRLAATGMGEAGAGRGQQTFYAWIDDPQTPLTVQVTGGLIAHYRDRGNVRIGLWQIDNTAEATASQTEVAHDASVPPDGVARTVQLWARRTGLHRLSVSDGGDMTRVTWDPGTPIAWRSSLEDPLRLSGRWDLYFYVPPGTKTIGLFADGRGRILDPHGQPVLVLDRKQPGYYRADVPAGTDNAVWKIECAGGAVRLLTVPPYLARRADELVLPAELVSRDR